MKGLIRLLGFGSSLLILALAVPIQAAPSTQSSDCNYYVDNEASSDGDGSWGRPWNDINDHVGDLVPGDTMCVRGDVSGPGQVYEVDQIYLDSEGGTVRDGVSGSPITIRSYPGEKVILRNVGNDSLVYFRGADYWIFEGFVMDKNSHGGRAVRFGYGANYNILRDNEIYGGGIDGIVIGISSYYDRNVDNVIENNHIHHFDAGDTDAHGVLLNPGSDGTIIRGNVIHDCSGDGIQIFATDDTPISEYSKNVRVLDNVFYRGTLLRSEDGIDIKGADSLEVTSNELYNYYWYGRAIVVHIGSNRNLLFDSNVFHDTSAGIDCHSQHLENITITNNLFYNLTIGQGEHYAVYLGGVYGATVYHNTIVNSIGYSFSISGDGIHGGEIRNNLVYNSGKANISTGAPFINVTVGYNAWFDAESEFTDPTDLVGSGAPGFMDAANDDYHLTAGSPVRDAGTDVGVTTDFEGDPRPFGNRPDIGADEYVPILYLTTFPRDRAIYLSWTEFEDPALNSYVITYTYGVGGSDASQGPSPIAGIPPTTHVYSLTEVTNYVFYTVTVAARDGNHADLAVSNSVRVMPTDIFAYLPLIVKEAP